MALTTSQIITLARAKLLETTQEIITDETILIYANLAYKDLVKKIFTADKVLSSTISFTNGSGTLPTLFGTLYGSAQDSNGTQFEEVSIEDFDNKTLSNMITIEGGAIKCYPTTTSSLTIKYYPTFNDLTITPTTTPGINEYFHELIVYGILSRAYEDLQDESLSQFYSSKYDSDLTKKLSVQSNYEETNQRGGQMFTYVNLLGGNAGGANYW